MTKPVKASVGRADLDGLTAEVLPQRAVLSTLFPQLNGFSEQVDGLMAPIGKLMAPLGEHFDRLMTPFGENLNGLMAPVHEQLDGLTTPLGEQLDGLTAPVGDMIAPVGDLTAPVGDLAAPVGDLTGPAGEHVDGLMDEVLPSTSTVPPASGTPWGFPVPGASSEQQLYSLSDGHGSTVYYACQFAHSETTPGLVGSLGFGTPSSYSAATCMPAAVVSHGH